MDLTRCLLLGVLVLGLLHSGYAKPSAKPATEEDYPLSDDDYNYDDDTGNDSTGTDRTSGEKSTNLESNNIQTPVSFKQANYTTTVRGGDTAKLECKPQNLATNSLILWFNGTNLLFNGNSPLTRDDRITLDDQSTLSIADVSSTDQGVFRCQVLPAKVELHVRLEVLTKPNVRILQSTGRDITEQTVELHQGESFEMECKGSGRPAPQIKWSSNGQRVVNGQGITVDGPFLSIEHADHEHVRKYQCLADNEAGVGHAGMSISVRYAPKVGSHRHTVNALLGSSADLHCNYNSSSETRIEWRKDGKAIDKHDVSKYKVHSERNSQDSHHRASLKVLNVQAADLGEYECDVRNAIGVGASRVQLQLQPEPPRFESVDMNEGSVVTHWSIRSHQALSEVTLSYMRDGSSTWLDNQPIRHEKSKEHSGLWKIQHRLSLTPGTWHTRVKARNTEGWSAYSEQKTFTVEPPIFGSEQFIEEITENRTASSASRSDCSKLFGILALSAILMPLVRRA